MEQHTIEPNLIGSPGGGMSPSKMKKYTERIERAVESLSPDQQGALQLAGQVNQNTDNISQLALEVGEVVEETNDVALKVSKIFYIEESNLLNESLDINKWFLPTVDIVKGKEYKVEWYGATIGVTKISYFATALNKGTTIVQELNSYFGNSKLEKERGSFKFIATDDASNLRVYVTGAGMNVSFSLLEEINEIENIGKTVANLSNSLDYTAGRIDDIAEQTYIQKEFVESESSSRNALNLSGDTTTYAKCVSSDFISVAGVESISIKNTCCAENYNVALMCFYDKEKNFISSVEHEIKGEVYDSNFYNIPATAEYVRFGRNEYNITYEDKGFVFIKKCLPYYFIEKNENNISDIEKYAVNCNYNYSIKRVNAESALNFDGSFNIYASCHTSEKIEVGNGKYFRVVNTVCASNLNVPLACFYDENDVFISAISHEKNNVIYDSEIYEIPVNATSMRLGINRYNMPKEIDWAICFDSHYELDFVKKYADQINESFIPKPYLGKNMLCLGDSYTYLGFYTKYLSKTTGCNIWRRGQNGAPLHNFADDIYKNYESNKGEVRYEDDPFTAEMLARFDIVTIVGGTNDYGHGSATYGSIETMESDGTTTICGSMYYLINKILSLNPEIKIVVCSQPYRLAYETLDSSTEYKGGGYLPNRNDGTGITMEGISNKMKEVCEHFGIPFFDFYHCSGWNSYSVRFANPTNPVKGQVVENKYTYDGLHPKDGDGNGADLMGTAFGMFINSH